jgi:predicted Fe-Mo cluster-binding NifX family protein
MKIAFISDDGVTISQHFGRAMGYLVVDVQDGKVVHREMREKMGHSHFSATHQHDHAGSEGAHGFDADSQSKHSQMITAIEDCQVVVCGGMGRGAYQSITDAGIEVFMTDSDVIDDALNSYLAGNLRNMSDLVH